jgi:penicillin-binding protein 1C
MVLSTLFYAALLRIFPFPYEAVRNIKYSTCVYDKDGNLLRAFTGKDESWLLPVTLKEINPNFIKATIAIEDKRFRQHHGVDIWAISRAVNLNMSNKRVISGASTISMQVIRILEGRKNRTFLNKIIEAVHAIRLETLYSKDEILKLYFEIAPYGGNIQGIKAASFRYFKKYPADLTLSECAILAGIPQSPSRLRPDRHPERAKKRRDMVLLSMLKNRFISQNQYNEAANEPVLAGNHSFPFSTLHFTEFVKRRNPGKRMIVSSIDSDIQHFAELALKDMVSELRDQGVTNGAVVIIENKTGKVRTMVGSVDFYSKQDSGQINGALSKRCPGSTLKPFTYALAFDKGLYTPGSVLSDMPVEYNGYTPLDYDKKYRGPVTAKEALVDSLNIPAVEILDNLGYLRLYMFLKNIGVTTLKKPPDYYGLALTLGSGEVNLLELTNAYATLARLGVYKPYSFEETSDTSISKEVLSDGAVYLVTDILSDTERLRSIGIYRDDKTHPKVAWKTGTSYGHKDAWTICYNPEYTVGIWLGNFSGKRSKALVGVDAAAPVALRIFDWLYVKKPGPWYKAPESIGERYVCELTGEPISEGCEHSVKDLYIKGHSLAKKCSLHDAVNVDFKTRVVFDKNKPKIISPAHKCEYFITNIPSSEQRLLLTANSPSDTNMLYWFIDGRFYDKSYIGDKLFWPMIQGKHTITCSDNYGRSSSVIVLIR